MPQLGNARWELFSRGLAKGMSQTAAYVQAGYDPDGAQGNASNLSKKPEIKERVAELVAERQDYRAIINDDREIRTSHAESYEDLGLSKQWVVSELMENVRLAREASMISASNKALEMLGKELGMFKDGVLADTDKKNDTSGQVAQIPSDVMHAMLEKLGLDAADFQDQAERSTEAIIVDG